MRHGSASSELRRTLREPGAGKPGGNSGSQTSTLRESDPELDCPTEKQNLLDNVAAAAMNSDWSRRSAPFKEDAATIRLVHPPNRCDNVLPQPDRPHNAAIPDTGIGMKDATPFGTLILHLSWLLRERRAHADSKFGRR